MKTMLAVAEALALIRSCCAPLPIEQVPLAEAFGRVLAAPVDAPRNLPPFANSAMDGFALRWREGLVEDTVLPVLAEQAAGDTREAVGGIELGQHEGAGVRLPIDVTIALLHQFMRFARHALRLEITGRDTLYRL